MATRTFTILEAARFNDSGFRASGDAWLPFGLWAGVIWRSWLRVPYDWKGVQRIVKAELYYKTTTQEKVARGGSRDTYLERATASTSESGVGWPGPATNTTSGSGRKAFVSGGADGTWYKVDVTGIVEMHAPATVKKADGSAGGAQPNHGLLLRAANEASTSDTNEIFSDDSSAKPYMLLTFDDNQAPNAPTGVTPLTGSAGAATLHPSTTGTRVVVSGTRSDADAGDYIDAVEVQVRPDSATDGAPGTLVASTTFERAAGTTPTTFAVVVTGLARRTTYRHRVRTRDQKGAWGDWTSLANGRFRTATRAAAPGNPVVDADTLTPNFYGSIVSADPSATISAARIVVYEDVQSTTGIPAAPGGASYITRWDSGKVAIGGSSTRFSVPYGGTALEWGKRYRWQARLWDQDDVESLSTGDLYWTPIEVTGPSNMTPRDVSTKQNTKTPTLTIGHVTAFDSYQLEVYDNPTGSGVPLWDVAPTTVASTTSVARTYAGTALAWGRVYWWRAAVVATGTTTMGPWSPFVPFYINALPGPPAVTFEGGVAAATPNPAVPGIVSPSTNPLITAVFDDPDASDYGDTAQGVELQVYSVPAPATTALGGGSAYIGRQATTQLAEGQKAGEQLLDFEEAPAGIWASDLGSPSLLRDSTTSPPQGTYALQINWGTSPFLGAGATANVYRAFTANLAPYTGATGIRIGFRPSTLTNLASVGVRFRFATTNDWALFTIPVASLVAATWTDHGLTKDSPTATNGTVDWANVTRIDIVMTASGAGAFTGNIRVDNLRIGTALTPESWYDVRVRYRDAATPTEWGVWSPWQRLKPSRAPTAALTAPTAGSTVTDPTPTLQWTYSSPGAKAQAAYRIELYESVSGVEQLRYDSGWVAGTATQANLPAFDDDGETPLLESGRTYRWQVSVRDSDGLTYTLV